MKDIQEANAKVIKAMKQFQRACENYAKSQDFNKRHVEAFADAARKYCDKNGIIKD